MRWEKKCVECCGHFWVPHLKDIDKLENIQKPMVRVVQGLETIS